MIASESGFKPDALKESTGAGGLIQFKPEVAEEFGTTVDDIRKMSLSEQLPLIDKYLSKNLPENATKSQLYGSVFMPSYADRDPDFQLLGSGDKFDDGEKITSSIRARYERNSGLDLDGDGFITVGELGSRIDNKMSEFGIKDTTSQKGSINAVIENKVEDLSQNILSDFEDISSIGNNESLIDPDAASQINQSFLTQNQGESRDSSLLQPDMSQVSEASLKDTETTSTFVQTISNNKINIAKKTALPSEIARMIL